MISSSILTSSAKKTQVQSLRFIHALGLIPLKNHLDNDDTGVTHCPYDVITNDRNGNTGNKSKKRRIVNLSEIQQGHNSNLVSASSSSSNDIGMVNNVVVVGGGNDNDTRI